MHNDRELLRQYAVGGSEAAFAEVVARYVNLVHGTALRRTNGDAALARDIAQIVFIDLARKADRLPSAVVLAGWLHRATRYAAADAMRAETRRKAREQLALAMNELQPDSAPDWRQIRPLLDAALDRLPEVDRNAAVLRFFEQRSLADIGRALGVSEDAARKRVARALDKMRAFLRHHGVSTTSSALSAVISTHACDAAPPGLAAALSAGSLAAAGQPAGFTLTLAKIMAMTKFQMGVAAILLAAVSTALLVDHENKAALGDENTSLRRQLAELRSENALLSSRAARVRGSEKADSTAPAQAASASHAPYDRLGTNLFKLPLAQLESYLQSTDRSAASLLAAFRTTGETNLLFEAAQKFPSDPHVAFEMAMVTNASPQDRRLWLETFKKSDPNNAVANYLSALDYFNSGQTQQALQECAAAVSKPFQDYNVDRYEEDAEAYLAAGYSVADSKAAAGSQLLLPQLLQLKNVGRALISTAQSYQQSGDADAAQSTLQLAIDLGQNYETPAPGEPLISQLVGIALEKMALSTMDPNAPYGADGQTIQERLNQLAEQRAAVNKSSVQVDAILPQMTDNDWITYRDRWMQSGEQNAEQWLLAKYGNR